MHMEPPTQSTLGGETDNLERPFYPKSSPCVFYKNAALDQGGCEMDGCILELGKLKAGSITLLYH